MLILSIDTSCDETAASVTKGRRVLSNVIYSQELLHREWGGVVPSLAKRAHEERIDWVVDEALRRSLRFLGGKGESAIQYIDSIAVTQGPGLAIALEVGIRKAKELAQKYNKKIIPINHMEGHIYSCFAQNSRGNPQRDFTFPYLSLLVSGNHTELVLLMDHCQYEMLGRTADDAAGEALDKAARMLDFGYPGGPVIERLVKEVNNSDFYKLPRPMSREKSLRFSFSGLKTSFYYKVKKMTNLEKIKESRQLASSFQEAVFNSLIIKTERAIQHTDIKNLVCGGGVIANARLRYLIRSLVKKYKGSALFPPFKYLTGDNAAMIGVAGYFKAQRGKYVENFSSLDREPRLSL